MKEKIKENILKKAAIIWGYSNSSIPSTLDPIVTLLLEACASEIENIAMLADESRARMLETLTHLLLPQSMSGVLPAYSILHAQPRQHLFTIPPDYQFTTSKLPKASETSIWTTYTQHTLFPLQIKYVQIGNKLHQYQEYWYTVPLQEVPFSNSWQYNRISIGLESENFNIKLNGLSFYFDIRNISDTDTFYQLLPFVKIHIGNTQLATKYGLNADNSSLHQHLPPQSWNNCSYENNTFKQLEKHFITIIDSRTIKEVHPIESQDNHELKDFENIIWFQITFPTGIAYQIIENVFININCFPVINKKIENRIVKTIPYLNIIPIETTDHFYNIKSVTNDQGNIYKIVAHSNPKFLNDHEVIIRNSGISRFDQRSISELINWIIKIIQTECIVFQTAKNDIINNQLEQLQQAITRLEELIPINTQRCSTTYLIFKPEHQVFPLNISFYSTLGALCTVKMGTVALEFNNVNLHSPSIRFMRNATGGRNKLSENEKIDAFRHQFLSHDRIITVADIEALCRSKFGKSICHINIYKGTTILAGNNGYCRSINIDICIKSKHFNEDQISYIKYDLEYVLKEKSTNLFPYVIKIIENAVND